MNEIISKQVAAELVVVDPFDVTRTHLAGDVNAIIDSGRERVKSWREKIAAMGDLSTRSVAALKAVRKEVEADNKTLTSYASRYADGVVDYCGLTQSVRALAVQIKGAGRSVDPASIRGGLEAIIADLDAAIAAQTPPEPTHTYVVRMTCTDKTLDKVCKAAVKDGAQDIVFAAAQSDKAVRQIVKWFEENV